MSLRLKSIHPKYFWTSLAWINMRRGASMRQALFEALSARTVDQERVEVLQVGLSFLEPWLWLSREEDRESWRERPNCGVALKEQPRMYSCMRQTWCQYAKHGPIFQRFSPSYECRQAAVDACHLYIQACLQDSICSHPSGCGQTGTKTQTHWL